jgi:hypothetical protein
MVVLTLHRDEPLSTDEISLLPPGCYPVFAKGDVVARAELSLPTAHTARFAAEMARAIPDADFVAEERPTAYGVALLEPGELEDPYWAHLPPMTFRIDPPGAATLAEGSGAVDQDSPLRTAEHTVTQDQQMSPEPMGDTDFESLARLVRQQDHNRNTTTVAQTPPTMERMSLDRLVQKMQASGVVGAAPRSIADEPAPQPSEPPPAMERMSLDTLVQQMRASGVVGEASEPAPVADEPAPQPSEPPPAMERMSLDRLVQQMRASGVVVEAPASASASASASEAGADLGEQVPSAIMKMFQSIRQQEKRTGQSLSIAGGGGHSSPPARSAAPRVAAADVSAPAEPGFWDHVSSGALEKAEEAARREGAALPEKDRLVTLLMNGDPAHVVLGLRVSKSARWGAAGRLLGRLVHHPDSEVRRELAQALRVLAPPDAEADLVILTRDSELSVSDAAQAALRRMKKRSRF